MSSDLAMLKAIRDVYRARFHSLLETKGRMNYDTYAEAMSEYAEADRAYLAALASWGRSVNVRAGIAGMTTKG